MGQYYLSEKLAQGGMAEIYKGYAVDLHGMRKTVVIKKILPHAATNREFIDMLVAEAKIAVMLSHGNIAQIYDLGKAGDDYFIVMEYVEGWSVSQWQRYCAQRGERLPIPITCHIISEALAGLDYMHTRTDERSQPLGIVHRDVSPQNIMLTRSGTIKIIDFGIAKARTKLETTEVGILKGKFAYMSPEHARGESIDSRSDIFSLGVIMHEMLTGLRLFKAKEARETLRNVRRADVPAPSRSNADVPAALDAIVLKLLARDRHDRYQRASTARTELLRFLSAHYPEFRAGQVADYVTERWREEAVGAEDDDGKTPFLILDHTQSAILDAQAGRRAPTAEHVASVQSLLRPYFDDAATEVVPEPSLSVSATAFDPQEPSQTNVEPTWRLWWHGWCDGARYRAAALWRSRTLRAGARVAVLCGALAGAGAAVWHYRAPLRQWGAQVWALRPQPAVPPTLVARTIPDTPVASIAVQSTPPGAQIYVDDGDTGLRTPGVVSVPAGHAAAIGLFLPGYRYATVSVTPNLEETAQISVVLQVER